jgi:3-phenylpropionate/cinnamic acid dioxygenase small subunit
MTDTEAISATLFKYAQAVDEDDVDALAECFTEDAVFEADNAHGADVPALSGRKAIVDFIHSERIQRKDRRRHLVSNIRVLSRNGDEATVHAYVLLATTGPDGITQLKCTASYLDEFRLEGGTWRIRSKQIVLDAPY